MRLPHMNLARTIALLILLTAVLPVVGDTVWPEHFPYVNPQSDAKAQRKSAAVKALTMATVRLGFCPSVTSLGLLLVAGLLVAGLEMTDKQALESKLE